MAQVIVVILANDKAEYFSQAEWTANAPNSLSGKSGLPNENDGHECHHHGLLFAHPAGRDRLSRACLSAFRSRTVPSGSVAPVRACTWVREQATPLTYPIAATRRAAAKPPT
jgi:hypothetical protein